MFKLSQIQPNPGWGHLCEECLFRFPNPQSDDFPCTKISAVLERYSLEGKEIFLGDIFFKDFIETCNHFVNKDLEKYTQQFKRQHSKKVEYVRNY